MNRKKIIIISIIVLVLAGLAIALLLTDQSFFSPAADTPSQNQNVNFAVPEVNKGVLPVVPQVKLTSTEQSLTTVARNFAERYGSFSSDSQFLNLEEVKLISTAKMQIALEQEKLTLNSGQGFYGVSSKALKTQIVDLNESAGTAQITVSLQRSQRKDGAVDFIYYQNLDLFLIKLGQSWLVDGVDWQE